MDKKNIILYLFSFTFFFIFSIYLYKYLTNVSNEYYYIFYLIISFTLFLIFLSFTFFPEKFKLYVLIFTISSVISIYSFELFFQIKVAHFDYNQNRNISKLKYYENLNKNNDYTVSIELKAIYNNKILPLAGISNMKTIHCNENGYFSEYISDRYGFNNPDDEWDKDEIEYLVVGDSFGHGNCVNRPYDISSVLRNISQKSVINLSYQGKGTLSYYASLREYFPKGKVNKILMIHYENDINDLNYEIKNNILRNYITNLNFTQNLKKKQKPINDLNKKIIENAIKEKKKDTYTFYRFHLDQFFKLYGVRAILHNILKIKKNKDFSQFKKLMILTKKLAEDNNAKLYFIILDGYDRYKYNLVSNDDNIKKIINELNIPLIDTYEEIFKKELNPLIFFPQQKKGHHNVEGYKTIAEKIYKLTN